ncbi:NtaA/DmoA family FMN-dependent monooxygenase [Patulibacter americanus]|uniref:NtaA/DmoA family FMN-dependent monooxygenase n=1 Tax=Patulibacter americanus TaxID=588672 RepID=UPI0003B71E35|nr:NtaA/DmoA family FMN-dependent monooxygenase [Patulibacter americanus]
MAGKKMILGLGMTAGYGNLAGAWRAPHVDPGNYAKVEANVRYAQTAERGGFAFLFTPDFPAVRGDVEATGVQNVLEPMMQLAAISQATERIGFVATGSTTFQEPFNTARQFKALDVMSHGRAGWNAVTTSDPAVAANYGSTVVDRAERYGRAHEAIQIVQALWGSWEPDAWLADQDSGRFLDASKLQPVNLQGQYVASRGPLPIPPSEQGQPVIFSSGGPSPHLLELAGRYASGFIAEVWTIEEARAQRELVRDAAVQAGRDPDEIKYFPGLMTTVAPTTRAGLDRRLALSGDVIEARLPHLGGLLGLRIDPSRYDEPLTPEQLAAASASPMDPRSGIVLGLAHEGWSPRDILAHGAIDYHPTTVGPAVVHADYLQAWLEADAADGFWISPDIYEDGVDGFVDEVVPELRRRGIFPEEYVGATLRENLGVPPQYGIDSRVTRAARGED